MINNKAKEAIDQETDLYDYYVKQCQAGIRSFAEVDDADLYEEVKKTFGQAALLLRIAQSTRSVQSREKFLDFLEAHDMIGMWFEHHRLLWMKNERG